LSWRGDYDLVRREGFVGLLSKPVKSDELLAAVSTALSLEHNVDESARRAGEQTAAERQKFSAHVLLAEDNPVNSEVAREYLSILGCTVTVAENGAEACREAASRRFDLVLMDCQMPEMDGLTATRRMRAREAELGLPRLPIIAVTANAFEEDRLACLAAGMDDYIRKPYAEEALEQVMLRWFKDQKDTKCTVATPVATPEAAPVALQQEPASPATAGQLVHQPVEVVAKAPALDMSVIDRMMETHAKLMGRLIDTYLNYAPKAIAQMHAAVTSSNSAGLKMAAHSLKSSSANVGAMVLSGLCRDLEAAMKIDGTSTDAATEAVAQIEAEYRRAADALRVIGSSIATQQAKAAS
jgi:CheY-like chemotaxis protein